MLSKKYSFVNEKSCPSIYLLHFSLKILLVRSSIRAQFTPTLRNSGGFDIDQVCHLMRRRQISRNKEVKESSRYLFSLSGYCICICLRILIVGPGSACQAHLNFNSNLIRRELDNLFSNFPFSLFFAIFPVSPILLKTCWGLGRHNHFSVGFSAMPIFDAKISW